MCFDKLMIRLRIKPRIQRQGGRTQIQTNTMAKSKKTGKGFGQNRCIMCVDRFRRYRTYNKSMIIGNRQFFFTFLVFVS